MTTRPSSLYLPLGAKPQRPQIVEQCGTIIGNQGLQYRLQKGGGDIIKGPLATLAQLAELQVFDHEFL